MIRNWEKFNYRLDILPKKKFIKYEYKYYGENYQEIFSNTITELKCVTVLECECVIIQIAIYNCKRYAVHP